MENMKLKQIRDVILAYMVKEELSIEEIKQVFQMCDNEVDAWVNRQRFTAINTDGEE